MERAIDIEKEFDTFVAKSKGQLVREILGPNPTFDNADYLFANEHVVAELKCLKDNKLEDPVQMGRMEQLWASWRSRGMVAGDIPETIQGGTIPLECNQELFSLCSKPLKRVLEKANKQIRQTKRALNLMNHHGLLLLANDGNFALPPTTLVAIVAKLLEHRYSEIEDFVVFSANMISSTPGGDPPCYLWISGSTSKGPKVPVEFVDQLGLAWKAHHESTLGVTLKAYGDPPNAHMVYADQVVSHQNTSRKSMLETEVLQQLPLPMRVLISLCGLLIVVIGFLGWALPFTPGIPLILIGIPLVCCVHPRGAAFATKLLKQVAAVSSGIKRKRNQREHQRIDDYFDNTKGAR